MRGKAVIIAEKPSAARKFAAALGGASGTFAGTDYEIVALAGHVMELAQPRDQVSEELSEEYGTWDKAKLHWDPSEMSWVKVFRRSPDGDSSYSESRVAALRRALKGAGEACIATDADPSGEGELLAWEAIDECGWSGDVTRMWFADEEPSSVRKAFEGRVAIPSREEDADLRMAVARERFDFLSMQLTRAATCVARGRGHNVLIRQGRLKSVMVALVGDQARAHDEYVRKPYFEARFRDGNGNVFKSEDAERHDSEQAVGISALKASAVVQDGAKPCHKAPPKLPDLAALAGSLAERGYGAGEVLDTYQRLYEQGILSYPRTEDRTVTPEQFQELLPLTDSICAAVGLDSSLVDLREARSTHVKPKGAHGANRPGPKVPSSLGDLKAYGACAPELYRLVATSWLATLASDLEYTRHSAHLEDYPDYRATSDEVTHLGWRAIVTDDEEHEEYHPFGKVAEPFVHEGANKRPQRPTVRWLMRKLESYEVGTGATRTSTLKDCQSGDGSALLKENKGALILTECGTLSHSLIRGCRIADPKVTEDLFRQMGEVKEGKRTCEDICALMAPMVEHDLARMEENAASIKPPADLTSLGTCPRCGGSVTRRRSGSVMCGSNRFEKRGETWELVGGCGWSMGQAAVHGTRKLTDAQIGKLLQGKALTLTLKSRKTGKPYKVRVAVSAEDEFGLDVSFAPVPKGAGRKGGGR